MNKGVVISFEGGDGSGKGTQSKMLYETMQAEGYKVKFESFPRYHTETGQRVAAYLNGAMGDQVDARVASELFSNDRLAAKPELEEWLAQGGSWVFDRYVDSNKGHQGGKLASDAERIEFFNESDHIEFDINGLPRPDKTILFTVPPELAQSYVDQKMARAYTDKKRDIHEADPYHLQNANESFLLFAAQNPDRVIAMEPIEQSKLAMLPREVIHANVIAALSPLLKTLTKF